MNIFADAQLSHAHSLNTLNLLYEFDDFMQSVQTVVDLGCGAGFDTEWWATRTTRDDIPLPLDIQCVGVDKLAELPLARQYPNITYQSTDFESVVYPLESKKYDILWCHDSFQYCIDPLNTLVKWRNIVSDSGMMVIIVPNTLTIQHKKLSYYQQSGCYYHHTMVSLIHMLAMAGWDCASGFFMQDPIDNYIHAVVYQSSLPAMDPKTTGWYDLAESGLLPSSAVKSVLAHGHLQQQDLILPWLDRSLIWMGKL